MFLFWLRELPQCGYGTPASVPPPAEGRSSPTNTPVFPPSSFILLWFYIFFSIGQVLLSALSWCSACTSVYGVFLMHHGERYTPCPPIPPPFSTVNYFVLCYSFLLGEGSGTPLQYSCLENAVNGGAWWAAVHGVTKSRRQLSDFTFTFHFHVLEKEMATHSSVLAWRIPGTGEPGGLPSMGSHRVRHDWSDLVVVVFLPPKLFFHVHWLLKCPFCIYLPVSTHMREDF